MMGLIRKKNLREYQKFATELKELCQKHGIYILGTCEDEGIYGEITLGEYENQESTYWNDAEEQTKFEIDYTENRTILR